MFTSLEIPALTSRTLVLDPPLSDEELERMSERSDFACFERDREGMIRMNPPAGALTSDANHEINFQLRLWWQTHRKGRTVGNDAGFFLPDGSMLSPDAAFLTEKQLRSFTHEQLEHFLYIAPAFILELRSPSDRLKACQEKMEAWISNGVEVGWLIDPKNRQAFIYQPGQETPETETGPLLRGTGPVDGFVLNLTEVWRCFE
jgi:Uma2 family endonuclease